MMTCPTAQLTLSTSVKILVTVISVENFPVLANKSGNTTVSVTVTSVDNVSVLVTYVDNVSVLTTQKYRNGRLLYYSITLLLYSITLLLYYSITLLLY